MNVCAVTLAALAVLAFRGPAPASAATQEAPVQEADVLVELRVLAGRPGTATLDRGAEDGLRRGDRVKLRLKDGREVFGTLVRLEERGSAMELDETTLVVPPGTRGEARVPAERFTVVPVPTPPPPEAPTTQLGGEAGGEPTAHAPWPERDDGWRQGEPLLARVRPLRPAERAPTTYGRIYSIDDFVYSSEDERSDVFARVGTEFVTENRYGRGERLHFDGELNWRLTDVPDDDDENEGHLRIDRASYASGGTRFDPERLELGRFLQHNAPEFGLVDGAEWGRRLDGGDRFAFSAGFMPKPEATPDSVDDFQASASYRWVYDESEQLSATAGYQKTLHHANADRDLFLAGLRYLPREGTTFVATVWADWYTGADDAKDRGLEVTQAYVSTGRRFEAGHSVQLVYAHREFPELDRDEFLPVTAQQLADDHLDRASLQTRLALAKTVRVHCLVGGWVDQDDHGRDVSGGFQFDDLFFERTTIELVGFANDAKFATVVGARAGIARRLSAGRVGLEYEIADSRLDGFSDANDDLPHHRVRLSTEHFLDGGWSLATHVDGMTWDHEASVVLGFYLQRTF